MIPYISAILASTLVLLCQGHARETSPQYVMNSQRNINKRDTGSGYSYNGQSPYAQQPPDYQQESDTEQQPYQQPSYQQPLYYPQMPYYPQYQSPYVNPALLMYMSQASQQKPGETAAGGSGDAANAAALAALLKLLTGG